MKDFIPFETVGTHNLLDGAAEARGFADVVAFTEAPKRTLRGLLIPGRGRVNVRRMKDHPVARTHNLYTCRWQRDLVIAIRKTIEQTNMKPHYRLVHPGVPKVTPHRGTFWLTGELDGVPSAPFAEHRINAWYSPWKRGEPKLRKRWHDKHHRITNRIHLRLINKGRLVAGGGDSNSPQGFKAYEHLNEYGTHLDRVACSEEIDQGATLRKGGSDHNRIRIFVKGREGR